jgi:uncharacterized OsmC-like protein
VPRATLTWKGHRRFDAEVGGHRLVIDSNPDGPAAGPTPMQLVLPAIGGCSGIDVAAILEKKRVAVTATDAAGSVKRFTALVRIDTPNEVDYYRHGGILQYVLRKLAGG